MQQTKEGFVHWSNQRSMTGFLKKKMSNFEQKELATMLHQTLGQLEVPTCYVALYEYPVAYKSSLFGFTLPAMSTLLLAQTGYRRKPELEGVPFATELLIPQGAMADRRTALGATCRARRQ